MAGYRRLMQQSMPADTVVVSIHGSEASARARYGWAAAMHRQGAVASFLSAEMPVEEALIAAEEARAEHGFATLAVFVEEGGLWRPEWGSLGEGTLDGEPLGVAAPGDLTPAEAAELAIGIERERDA